MNKNKKIGLLVLAVVLLVGVGYVYLLGKTANPQTNPVVVPAQTAFDPKNATYVIDGNNYTLVNGVSSVEAAPGSASKITTRYFGNVATGDLNGDGLPDMAYLITQDGGGSGTFFYAVVALKTAGGYKLTNTFFLGDRIAPQTTEINTSAQELYINYATRRPGEPMTAQPSQGVTQLLMVNPDGSLTGLKGKL